MQNKKEFKITLKVLLILLLFILISVLSIIYFYTTKINLLETENESLMLKIESLESDINNLEISLDDYSHYMDTINDSIQNQDEVQNNSDYVQNQDKLPNTSNDYLQNVIIKKISDTQQQYAFQNPQISFNISNDWNISTNNDSSIWNITLAGTSEYAAIKIFKSHFETNSNNLKDLISLDDGSLVLDEGPLKISEYDAYFKKYSFGDGLYRTLCKYILIYDGNNNYYEIFYEAFAIDPSEDTYYDIDLESIYNQNESTFNSFLNSLKF